jgi:hypothetical protein
MFRCISAFSLTTAIPCYYTLYIILLLHLLSINHKYTQLCYFPPATQICHSEVEEDLEYYDKMF